MPLLKTGFRRTLFVVTPVTVLILLGGLGALYTFAMPTFGSLFSAVVSDGGVHTTRDIAYGPDSRQKLDIYRPEDGADDGPIAVFIYGGGWRSGDRSTYGFVGAAFAGLGMTTVVPDYRLFPDVEFPDFVHDAAAAYRWVSQNLAAREGSNRPIVLIGHSAGAHIGALLAVDRRYLDAAAAGLPAPAAFIGLAGPYAFDPTTFESTKEIFASVADARQARPAELVTAGVPPALVMHGLDDKTVKIWNTRTFAEAMTEAGARVEKREFENIGHVGIVLSLAWPFRWRAPVLEEIRAFVDTLPVQDGRQGVS